MYVVFLRVMRIRYFLFISFYWMIMYVWLGASKLEIGGHWSIHVYFLRIKIKNKEVNNEIVACREIVQISLSSSITDNDIGFWTWILITMFFFIIFKRLEWILYYNIFIFLDTIMFSQGKRRKIKREAFSLFWVLSVNHIKFFWKKKLRKNMGESSTFIVCTILEERKLNEALNTFICFSHEIH